MPQTLDEWLTYQEKQHTQTIDLGLERIRCVYQTLFAKPHPFTAITVAGTNGKGSTLAFLERIYIEGGYRVGLLTSPHIFCYNERIRIDGQNATDAVICQAFATIEAARGSTTLTYFEYSALAALVVFEQQNVDVALLEVGLGGRLDAVNVVDTDCALITSIDIDHSEYLGNTRDQIAIEKAGIVRANAPLVCAERNPPETLVNIINAHPDEVRLVNKPYDEQCGKLALSGEHQRQNAAGALAAVEVMQHKLPVSNAVQINALQHTVLCGRYQQLMYQNKRFIFDVAHNEAGVGALANTLTKKRKRAAIFAVLKDKNIGAMIDKMNPLITQWLLIPLGSDCSDRALSTKEMQIFFQPNHNVLCLPSMASAFSHVINSEVDEVVVFGSFYTVSAGLRVINER